MTPEWFDLEYGFKLQEIRKSEIHQYIYIAQNEKRVNSKLNKVYL